MGSDNTSSVDVVLNKDHTDGNTALESDDAMYKRNAEPTAGPSSDQASDDSVSLQSEVKNSSGANSTQNPQHRDNDLDKPKSGPAAEKKSPFAKLKAKLALKKKDDEDDDAEFLPPRKSKKAFVIIPIAALIMAGAGYTGYSMYTDYEKKAFSFKTPKQNANELAGNPSGGTNSSIDNKTTDAIAQSLIDEPSLASKKPSPIPEALENEYIKKISTLEMKLSMINATQSSSNQQIYDLQNQVRSLTRVVREMENLFSSLPKPAEIEAIKASVAASDQKLSFIKESATKAEFSIERANDRGIQNATSLEMLDKFYKEKFDAIFATFSEVKSEISTLGKSIATTNYSVEEPTKVTYGNGTSITRVPSSKPPVNKQALAEPEIVKELTLVTISKRSDSTPVFLVEGPHSNNYELPLHTDLGAPYGVIKEFINGSYSSEPYLVTSNNYIITTHDGKKGIF